MKQSTREGIIAAICFAFALFIVVGAPLLLVSCPAQATTYDPNKAKGFPPLSDTDSVIVPLYSIYDDGRATVDSVRMPKPEDDSVVIHSCVRLAPSTIAQCLIGMKTLGFVFAVKVPLNLTEV